MPNKKVGLVLEGGGVKGVYELGAMKALVEHGYTFGAVTGTSIGALNGAAFVSQGLSALEKYWEFVKDSPVFDFDPSMIPHFKQPDFDLDKIFAIGKKLVKARTIIRESQEKTVTFIRDNLVEKDIRDSEIDFGLVTYNITDMKPVEIMKGEVPEGQLVDYVIASACFPIFSPIVIAGKKHIDGGVYDNLPINLMARAGWKDIIAIRTHPTAKDTKRKITHKDLNVLYIAPSCSLGRALAFSPERIESLKQMGYDDAIAVLNALESGESKEAAALN